MELLLLPFFMPLFLLGWLLPPEHERELRKSEQEQEKQIAATWAILFGRESQVLEVEALGLPAPDSAEPEQD